VGCISVSADNDACFGQLNKNMTGEEGVAQYAVVVNVDDLVRLYLTFKVLFV
jgi:hypothetical protein